MRGHLGSFGIKGALATQKMSQLSGGQAVRVGLAAVAYAEPHLLVLVSLLIQRTICLLVLSSCSYAYHFSLLLGLVKAQPMCFDCFLTCHKP